MEEVKIEETVSELPPPNMISAPEISHASQSKKEIMRFVTIPSYKIIKTYGSGTIPASGYVWSMTAEWRASPCNNEDKVDTIFDNVTEKTKQLLRL